jgi:hypothetical protein
MNWNFFLGFVTGVSCVFLWAFYPEKREKSQVKSYLREVKFSMNLHYLQRYRMEALQAGTHWIKLTRYLMANFTMQTEDMKRLLASKANENCATLSPDAD